MFDVKLALTNVDEPTDPRTSFGVDNHNSFRKLIVDLSSKHPFCDVNLIMFAHAITEEVNYNPSRSVVPGLYDSPSNYRKIKPRRETLIGFLKTVYFNHLLAEKHNVLYSLPVLKVDEGSENFKKHHWHAMSSTLMFQTVPFCYNLKDDNGVTWGRSGSQRISYDRDYVIFMGLLDPIKPLDEHPSQDLVARVPWIVGTRNEVPYGTVCLSRTELLDAQILSELNKLSKFTTIVPISFTGMLEDKWNVELKSWGRDEPPQKPNIPCHFERVKPSDGGAMSGVLCYEWKNFEELRHTHRNDGGIHGQYTITCELGLLLYFVYC